MVIRIFHGFSVYLIAFMMVMPLCCKAGDVYGCKAMLLMAMSLFI